VPRVIYLFIFGLGGAKLLQLQNLGGNFVVFFLGGQNRNFVKVRGRKLQLSQDTFKGAVLFQMRSLRATWSSCHRLRQTW